MASKAAILNAALHHLGETESTDPLNDTATWVTRLRSRYDAKTRLLFEKHPWNFCTEVEQLSATEPTPEGWAYGFAKPNKCWRIVRVTNGGLSMDPKYPTLPYRDQAGRILTNHETTYLMFIDGDWLSSEGSWPEVFAEALAAELAWSVLPVSSANGDARDRLERIAKKNLREAKNWDAQQNPIWQPPPSKWQVSRWSTQSGARRDGF